MGKQISSRTFLDFLATTKNAIRGFSSSLTIYTHIEKAHFLPAKVCDFQLFFQLNHVGQ
jgi:hypothetical protein